MFAKLCSLHTLTLMLKMMLAVAVDAITLCSILALGVGLTADSETSSTARRYGGADCRHHPHTGSRVRDAMEAGRLYQVALVFKASWAIRF